MKYLKLLFLCINLLWIGNLSYLIIYSSFSSKENSKNLTHCLTQNFQTNLADYQEIYRKIISDIKDTFFYVNSQLIKQISNNETAIMQSSLNDRFK